MTTKSLGCKDSLDRFYTKKDVAAQCIAKIDLNKYNRVIEPACGDGAFSSQIPNCEAFDIELGQDFFQYTTERNYFIKINNGQTAEEFCQFVNSLNFPTITYTVGPKSLSKTELIQVFEENFYESVQTKSE